MIDVYVRFMPTATGTLLVDRVELFAQIYATCNAA